MAKEMMDFVSKKTQLFEAIPRLIYVQSNKKIIPGFGISPFLNDAPTVNEIPRSNFIFSLLVKQFRVDNNKINESFDKFTLCRDKSIVYCNKVAPLISLNLLFNPFKNKIVANPFYFHLIKEKVESVYPAGVILLDWVYIKLLLDDYLIIHAGGVSYSEHSYLFIAPPNTGKTTTVLRFLVKNNSYKYLGEDSVILDVNKNKVYSTPHTSTFLHHDRSTWTTIINGTILPVKYKPTARRLFKNRIQESPCEIDKIFVLRKSPQTKIIKISDANAGKAIDSVLNIQRYEFSWFKNSLIRAAAFLLDLNLDKLLKKEETLVERTIRNNIGESYFITAPDAFDFYRLINKLIG